MYSAEERRVTAAHASCRVDSLVGGRYLGLEHLQWLSDTGERIETQSGPEVEVWVLDPQDDDVILASWAEHFRQHYCLDAEIDDLRRGYDLSRKDYLLQLVFPDASAAPGPSIRAGDFAEILVADYLEFVLGYSVPRWRYDEKQVRNESTKGTDIIGFHVAGDKESPADELAIYEVKATLSGAGRGNRLQDALDGSAKDFNLRKAESLNAMRRRYLHSGHKDLADMVMRFQNRSRRPYREVSGAAVLLHNPALSRSKLAESDCSSHPNRENLRLLAISGADLMNLVHALYGKASEDAER